MGTPAPVEHVERWTHTLRVLAYVTMLLAGAVLGVLMYRLWWQDHDAWDPLGKYPQQRVESRQPIANGTPVDVHGVKCNDSGEAVVITGTVAWRLVSPLVSVIETGRGARIAPPGCTRFDYTNPMPDQVVALNRNLFAQGAKSATWQIVGTETPVDDDGRTGVVRPWTTETFKVVP